MKIYRYILLIFLSIWNQSSGQQIINHVYDPSAAAIRGFAIPGMLGAAITMKNEQANRIIPDIIREESTELSKWKKTVIGNANSLTVIAFDTNEFLIDSVERFTQTFPVLYAPGFRKELNKFLLLNERLKRLNKRVATLAGLSIIIDGEGYYRVATQRLAIEYLEVHSELAKMNFKLSQLRTFIILLPLIAA